MWRVENECLVEMKSPVRYVFKYLHRAIINIAPERYEEFERKWPDLTLVYDDTPKWIFKVEVANKRIIVSRKAVEVVWAAAYSYFVIYNDVIRHQDITKQVMVDLTTDERVKKSCRLLQWAIETWLNESNEDWPADLPMPSDSPENASNEHVADELTLGALGFMLHHELAHISLQHCEPKTLEKEREADYAAIDWIFERVDRSDVAVMNKRALCCALALSVLCAKGVHTRCFGGLTHPPSYDRLVNGLLLALEDDRCHLAWFFVSAILSLHMTNAGLQLPNIAYETPYDCVEDMADQLSRVNITGSP